MNELPYLELANNWLYLSIPWESKETAKRIPGWRWCATRKAWEYPFNATTLREIKNMFPWVTVDASVKQGLSVRGLECASFEALQNGRTEHNDLKFKLKPYPFQKAGIEAGLWMGNHLNLDDMGLGKTMQALIQLQWYFAQGKLRRAWVFCPKSLTHNWLLETRKWTDLEPLVVEGVRDKRKRLLRSYQPDIFILNYDIIRLHKVELVERIGREYSAVVCDEVQYVKNPESQRTRAVFSFQPVFRIGLTGTPIMNRVEDVYAPMQWVTEKREWRNVWEFKNRYIVSRPLIMGRRKIQQVVGYKNLKELKGRLERVSVRRLKEDVLPQLPPKVYHERTVRLLKEEGDKYQTTKELFIQKWRDTSILDVKKRLEVQVQVIRLMQLCCGFQQDGRKVEHYPSAKLNLIEEMLVQHIEEEGKKVVVFSIYVAPIIKMLERFQRYNPLAIWGNTASDDRFKYTELFQRSDNHPLIVAQVEAGGVGLNYAPKDREVMGIFLTRHPSPGKNKQAEDRLHRITTYGDSVNIVYVIAENTIDEKRKAALERKEADIAEVVKTGDTERIMEML